jgi:hypothetical protein
VLINNSIVVEIEIQAFQFLKGKDKGKAIPLQAWTGPDYSRRFEVFHISRQSAHEDSKIVNPTNRPPLPPRKYSW